MRKHLWIPFLLPLLGASAVAQSYDKGFTKTKIASNNGNAALEVGPDGHLYVGDVNGKIKRYRLDAAGKFAGAVDTLVSLTGARILGLAFDPDATATNLVLFASVNLAPRSGGDAGSAGEWNGKIVRYVLPAAGQGGTVQAQDKIVNLPTGFHDVNGITFGSDKKLYICAGSTTTLGGTGRNSKDVKEKLLSAAILQADVKSIAGTLDVKTEQGGTYNPYASGAAVRLYATGLRNAYDCAWLNGNLYAGNNQNDVNGSTGSCDGVPNLNDIKPNEYLALVKPGKYYGHPNGTRGECVLMGGNPTSGSDPWEISAYPAGIKPEAAFDPSLLSNIAPIGGGSADGCVGYDVPGPLQGRLVVCFFGNSGGGKVMTFSFGADGRVTATEPVKDGNGAAITFTNPLDVALRSNGNLYIATYGTWDASGTGGEVYLLTPLNPAGPSPQPTIARSPTSLSASAVQGQNASSQSFQVWNSGGGTLSYTASDDVSWLTVSPTNGSSTGSGQKVAHTVAFSTSGLAAGTHRATISIAGSNATNSPQPIPVTLEVRPPANTPPVVNAGPNQTLAFPAAAALDGTVSDDGLPNPPGRVTVTWSQVSGPGTATFADPNAVDTTASFSAAGTYGLRLTASDGELHGSADVTITLASANNQLPSVTAAADRTTIALGETVNLTGSATDDGLPNPPGALSYRWTIATGPNVGTVTFGDESSPNTTAAFSDASTYTLRLTASDGELSSAADVTVTVKAPSGSKAALFVVGSTTLAAGDQAARARLEGAGFMVTTISASAATAADAAGKHLVVVSSTVSSGTVGTKFRDVSAGVLTWEAWLFDDFGMTGSTAGTDYGLAAGRAQVAVANASHSMAAGLSGTVTVVTSASDFMWGAPNAQAIRVATLAGDAGKAALFGYEAGAAMPGLSAPGRRVGIFLSDASASLLTADGAKLFDAAAAWASGSAAGGGGMGSGTGLTGEYYDNIDFTGPLTIRTDSRVDFDWGAGAPDSSMGADTFSVRWTGLLEAPASGTYTFYARTDDGVRLWVDGRLLIDAWLDQAATEWSGTTDLAAGARVSLRVEYYENSGQAAAELRWSGPGIAKDFIPSDRLYILDSDGDGVSDVEEQALRTGHSSGGGSSGSCGALGLEAIAALLLRRRRRPTSR